MRLCYHCAPRDTFRCSMSSYPMPYCSNLRTDLDSLALPKDPDIPEHKKFFSKFDIRKLFAPDAVTDLLACTCQRCTGLRESNGIQLRQMSKVANAIIGAPKDHDMQRTFLLILGLLLYIDYPALIAGFVQRKCYDCCLEADLRQLTAIQFQQKFWPKLLNSAPKKSSLIMERFRWKKYNFFVPTLDNKFSTYDQHTILPFINEKKVGRKTIDGAIIFEGAYGRIYSFEIHDEYREFIVSVLSWMFAGS